MKNHILVAIFLIFVFIVSILISGCQIDKKLIVEFQGTKTLNNKDYNSYSILNPNERRVLAEIQTHCYNQIGKEIPSNDKQTVFIDSRSELTFDYGSTKSHLWYTDCPEETTKTSVSAVIIG